MPEDKVALVDHVITQEDLDLNPELVAEGVKIGDVVGLPMTETPLTEAQKAEIAIQHPELADKLDIEAPTSTAAPVPGTVVKEFATNGIRYKRVVQENGSTLDVRA